jgi:hypothetical protein
VGLQEHLDAVVLAVREGVIPNAIAAQKGRIPTGFWVLGSGF